MRSLQRSKGSFFPAMTVVSAAVYLTFACGACGGSPRDAASAGERATGDQGAPRGGGAGSTPGDGTTGNPASDPGSSSGAGTGTTTDALPPSGELQGAKLGSATHTEVETKGDAGSKAGPGHAQEPGRRREDIQAIVMAHRDEARACYDNGLKNHPGIEGDLAVKFVIDPHGTVTDASVDSAKSTIREPTVGSCIAEVIKRIKFAPSKGGFETRASYPFNFHPKTFGKADAGAK